MACCGWPALANPRAAIASASWNARSKPPTSSGSSSGSQSRSRCEPVAADRLRLADLPRLAQRGRHKRDRDCGDHRQRVERAWDQPDQRAGGQQALGHHKGHKQPGQRQPAQRAEHQRLQRDRAAQQRQPARQAQQHGIAVAHAQRVQNGRDRRDSQREAQRRDRRGAAIRHRRGGRLDHGDAQQHQHQVQRVAPGRKCCQHRRQPADPRERMDHGSLHSGWYTNPSRSRKRRSARTIGAPKARISSTFPAAPRASQTSEVST